MDRRSTYPLLMIATILGCNTNIPAQSVGGGVAVAIRCGEHPPPPPTFTTTWKITTVQKRKNGLAIANVRTEKVALDSVGRSYHLTHSTAWRGGKPGSPDTVLGSIDDPMRRVMITWNSGSMEAAVFHAPNLSQPPREKPAQPPLSEADCPPMPSLPLASPDPAVEHLGPKTIHGMVATGTRFSVVIPAQPGTNKPAVTAIEESWYSSDYNVEVLRIVKCPDGDYEKSELVGFEDGAPDPGLFEIPEGYTIRDVYQDAPPPL